MGARAEVEELARGVRTGPIVLVVVAAALVQRSISVLVMLWCIGPARFIDSLMSYDATLYRQIARGGYHLAGEDGFERSNLPFFPLYPGAARLMSMLPGVSVTAALLVLAFVGSVLAALPIFAVGRHLHSTRVGVLMALLWGALPQSFVLVMGYAEGWFTAATGWSLLFMLRRRPLAAAGAAVVAGLLRPAAVPLVVVIMLWCVVQWFRDPDRSGRWVAAAIIAPLGVGSFLVYVAWRTSDLLGYFAIQKQWNLQTGPPWAFWEQIVLQLRATNTFAISTDIHVPIVLGYVALLVVLLGWWRREDHAWVILYTLLGSLLILTRATYFWSEARQFMALFPLLLPLASIRTSPWAWGALVLGMTAATAWMGGEFLLARQYSP